MNRVILLGNLGTNPVLKTSERNVSYVVLALATHEQWSAPETDTLLDSTLGPSTTSAGSPALIKHRHTDWHRVVIFKESLINFATRYLKKGSKVVVEGKLKTRTYTTENGPTKIAEVVVGQGYGYITSLSPKEQDVPGPFEGVSAKEKEVSSPEVTSAKEAPSRSPQQSSLSHQTPTQQQAPHLSTEQPILHLPKQGSTRPLPTKTKAESHA